MAVNEKQDADAEYAGAFGEGEAVYSAGGDGSLSRTRRQHHHRT